MTAEKTREQRAGTEFQQVTRYDRQTLKEWSPDWDQQVSQFKRYEGAEVLELPDPKVKGGGKLWNLIAGRRSFRDYEELSIDIKQLSQLLWASQGITARTRNFFLRAAPSSGALYPIETYVICNHVEGAKTGVYHYDVGAHGLELIIGGDTRDCLMDAGMNQPVFYEAAVAFVWTAMVQRGRWKYHERAWRYFYLDCGHLAQNLLLAAESLGLGASPIGAFFDREVAAMIEVDPEEEPPIYMAVVGPKGK